MLTAQDIRKLEQNYAVTSDEYKLIETLWNAMELLEIFRKIFRQKVIGRRSKTHNMLGFLIV